MKLFAIVIDTLDKSYQGVQIGHAVSKLASKHPDVDWDHQTFVWLKAGEFKFMKMIDKLRREGIHFQTFTEPDIGNKLTAIACLTDKYSIFKSLDLF